MVWIQQHIQPLSCGCLRGIYKDGKDLLENPEFLCDDHHPPVITPDIQEYNTQVQGRLKKIRKICRLSRLSNINFIDKYIQDLPVDFSTVSYSYDRLNNGNKKKNPAEWIHRDRLLIHKYFGEYYCCKNRVDYLQKALREIEEQVSRDKQAFIDSMNWTTEDLALKPGIPWTIYKPLPVYEP